MLPCQQAKIKIILKDMTNFAVIIIRKNIICLLEQVVKRELCFQINNVFSVDGMGLVIDIG